MKFPIFTLGILIFFGAPTLAKNHTVIVPDLRGLGDSSKPLTGYDGKTVAEDIHQLVTQLGFKRIFLVSHDVGSQPAYSYAAHIRQKYGG